MAKGKIVIISGPSGSGKTTLHKMLLDSPAFKGKLVKSISITTRQRREDEKNGKDYIFVTPKRFLFKIRAKHFLEWQKVFDNHYGTPKKNVRDLLKSGKNVLLCIDVKGAEIIRKAFPDAISIFIKTPSLAVLKKRLEKRAQDSQESKELRLRIAKEELAQAKQYDHRIVNDNLQSAYRQLEKIVSQALLPPVL
jgi:guanylate kinase